VPARKPAMAPPVKPAPAPASKRTLAAPPRTVQAGGEEWEAF
jgi:hypothetical protein